MTYLHLMIKFIIIKFVIVNNVVLLTALIF
jgi:hypothetical protein